MLDDVETRARKLREGSYPSEELWRLAEAMGFELSSAGYQKTLVGLQRVTATVLAVLAQLLEQEG